MGVSPHLPEGERWGGGKWGAGGTHHSYRLLPGYSLPWDQVGYWAVKIVSGVPAAIPVIGDFMVELLRGGESVGQSTLTRFYSLHTFVLPWSLAVFMLMHFLMIRKQGISGPL